MATITTRAGKGSPLTNDEVDANFTNLNTDKAELSGANFTGAVDVDGNITTTGTVDGRDIASDGTKLDGIESGATADQTAAEIRAAVEAATDSNVFTDADHTKLDAIEANATADQTASEIRTLVDSATDSNVFTDADHTKLDGIEASADVTDTANVTAAGALMDSELTDITAVKSLDQGVATTDSPTFAGIDVTGTVTADGLTVEGTSVLDSEANFTSATTSADKSLVLASSGATGGNDQYGASLAFSRVNTQSPRAAIAAVNTDSNFERMGLSFWTHVSNVSSDPMNLRYILDHQGNHKWYKSDGSTLMHFWGYEGNVTFNEGGADADFRVESDSNTHAFFLDAGNSRIGLNQSSPNFSLHIGDGTQGERILLETSGGGASIEGKDSVNAPSASFRIGHLTGTNRYEGAIGDTNLWLFTTTDLIFKPSGGERFRIGTNETVVNEASIDYDFRVESNNNANMLFVDAGVDSVGIGTGSPSSTFALDVAGSIRSQGTAPGLTLYETDASNQQWIVGSYGGTIALRDVTAGTYPFQITTGAPTNAVLIQSDGVKINEGSADLDFRVESNNITSMLMVDAGDDEVYVGGVVDLGSDVMTVKSGAGVFNALAVGANTNNSTAIGNFTSGDVVANLITSGSKFGGLIQGGTNGNLVLGIRDNDTSDGLFVISGAGDQITNDYSRLRLSITSNATIFNETGDDTDFRVESDTNTHALFVDAGNSRVGINKSAPNRALDVHSGTASDITTFANDSGGYTFGYTSNLASWDLGASDALRFRHGSTETLRLKPTESVFNEIGTDVDFRVESDNNANMLVVDAGNDRVGVGTTPSELFHARQDSASGAVYGIIQNDGTPNTATIAGWGIKDGATVVGGVRRRRDGGTSPIEIGNFSNNNNSVYFQQNAENRITLENSTGSVVVNEDSLDQDFRVESNNNANMLFVDGANDTVGIGTNSTIAQVTTSTNTGKMSYYTQRVMGSRTNSASASGSSNAKTAVITLTGVSLHGLEVNIHISGHFWNNGGNTYYRHTKYYLMSEGSTTRINDRTDEFLGGSQTGVVGTPSISLSGNTWTIQIDVDAGYVIDCTVYVEGPGADQITSITFPDQ